MRMGKLAALFGILIACLTVGCGSSEESSTSGSDGDAAGGRDSLRSGDAAQPSEFGGSTSGAMDVSLAIAVWRAGDSGGSSNDSKYRIEIVNTGETRSSFTIAKTDGLRWIVRGSDLETVVKGGSTDRRDFQLAPGEAASIEGGELIGENFSELLDEGYDRVRMLGTVGLEDAGGAPLQISYQKTVILADLPRGEPALGATDPRETTQTIVYLENEAATAGGTSRDSDKAGLIWDSPEAEASIEKARAGIAALRNSGNSAQTASPPEADGKFFLYSDPKFDFSISYPAGWEPNVIANAPGGREELGGNLESVVAFSYGAFIVMVLSEAWEGADELKEWADAQAARSRGAGAEATIGDIEINGQKGFQVDGIGGWNLIFFAHDRAYRLHSTRRNEFGETIDAIAATFSIEP